MQTSKVRKGHVYQKRGNIPLHLKSAEKISELE